MEICIDVAVAQHPKTFTGPGVEPLSGKSLAPIFRGAERKGHDFFYHRFSANRALRQGDLKIASSRSVAWELYNLAEDRTELNDLATEYPDRVKAMVEVWNNATVTLGRGKPAPVKAGPGSYKFRRQKDARKQVRGRPGEPSLPTDGRACSPIAPQ